MRRILFALLASLCTVTMTSTGAVGGSPPWTVYDYNPSGRALAPRVADHSMPATTSGSTTTFRLVPGTFTALLVTNDSALTGDLSGNSLLDTVTWSGTGGFAEQNGGGCVPDHQFVRFYVESPSAAGPSTGTPPRGFYTQFWWSNPVQVDLAGDSGSVTMIAPLSWPAASGMWSDWNGQSNAGSADLSAAFIEATQKVQLVGLSFGGGCFFENGLTTTSQGTFTSTFGEV
jgi:hypothetical protein